MKKTCHRTLTILLALILLVSVFASCTQANRVSENISQEADNFNVIRRLVVLNARTDKPMFELVGAFSFTLEENRIIVIAQTGPNEYKKHSVGLCEWTLWSVEDLFGADVSPYRYEVNFLPQMIVPIEFTMND